MTRRVASSCIEGDVGPLFRLIASTGIGPSFIVILARGRRSGRTHSTVRILAEHARENYLAAAVDYSDWVLNAMASGGQATVRHGKRRLVFKLSPGTPIEKFQEIAAEHPVFKILEV